MAASWWVIRKPDGSFTVVQSPSPPITLGAVAGGPFATKAQAQADLAGIAGSAPSAPPKQGGGAAPVAGGCGPQAIYNALLANGFSTAQAVGAMANAIAESTLNPEASVIDSNGARSNGLWQFNEATYPDSGKLITGNCANDIASQVAYLKTHVSGNALNGQTGAEVAGNFAANFERCKGCTAGDTSTPNGWGTRVNNAAKVQGWITSGNWPTASAGITGGSGGGGGGGIVLTSTISPGTCVIPLNIPVAGQFCLLSKGQARGVLGVLLMIGGGLLLLPGLLVLAAAGLERTGAGAAAGKAASVVPVGRVARGGAAWLSGVSGEETPAPKKPAAKTPAPKTPAAKPAGP